MLNYTELTHNLHKAIRAAGYSLVKHDGVFVTDNETEVQAIIDSFNPIPQLRAELKEQLVIDSQSYVDEIILSKYPKFEVNTFQDQLNEAQAFMIDNGSITPFIDKIAARRNRTRLAVATKIITRNTQSTDILGEQVGEVHRLKDLIDAASTVEQLNAIPKFVGV